MCTKASTKLRTEVTGGWRELFSEELHNLYSSAVIITITKTKSKSVRRSGHVACMEGTRNEYEVLVGKPEGKRALGRPMSEWQDNTEMDLK
jgi:hypothetical protein